jgi:rhamnosyltransferase
LGGIQSQNLQPDNILVIDSSSRDETSKLVRAAGFQLVTIAPKDFNHGRTRQLALQLVPQAEILVYLTQDAVLADANALRDLVASFADSRVALAYGRQSPRQHAADQSQVRCFADRQQFGIKTVFCSNSFAAYRRSALEEVGGFPEHVILGEDMVTAARLLQKEYCIAYVSSACVFHSHGYSVAQEFRRYFDTGVLHRRDPWLQHVFGHAGDEGMRFVYSELRYLACRAPWLLPVAPLRTAAKWIGYRLGCMENLLSTGVKRAISMHGIFWDED